MCCDLAEFDDHRLFGTLAFRNGLEYQNFDLSMLIGNRQSFVYILCKCGEICISDPGVLGERSCTAGVVDNCYHA